MSRRAKLSGLHRDERVIAGVSCPRCHAPRGQRCIRPDGKPWPCSERRAEWVRVKPR